MTRPRRRFGPLLYVTLAVAGATVIGLGLFCAWPGLERWREIDSLRRDLWGPTRAGRVKAASRLAWIGLAAEPTLLAAMQHPDDAVRSVAGWGLARLAPRSPEVVEAMIFALKDRNDAVRHRAAQSLASSGQTWPAWSRQRAAIVAAMRGMLRHDDPRHRLTAADVLLGLGDESRTLAIGEMLAIATDPRLPEPLRHRAITSLPARSEEDRPEVIAALLVLLDSRDPKVRHDAIDFHQSFQGRAILGPAAKAAVPRLLDSLSGTEAGEKYRAACAILAIDPTRSERPIAALAELVADSDVPNPWRWFAMTVLIKESPETARGLLPVLTEQFRDGDLSVRVEVGRMLTQAGPQGKASMLRVLQSEMAAAVAPVGPDPGAR